jgi:protein involved in polysaccharide export with SLBB domain
VAVLALAGCSPRQPLALAPLPDRPWTVLAGDEISVRVFREPELNAIVTVNGRGEVFLPALGRMMVLGLTADSLSQQISAGFEKRLINSVVDVQLVRLVPVIGEVRQPGEVAARPTMTVQQLVARAGGQRSTSRRMAEVYLRKGTDGTLYRLANDLRLDRMPLSEGDALVVYDPSVLERWNPWLESLNKFGAVLTITLTAITLSSRR